MQLLRRQLRFFTFLLFIGCVYLLSAPAQTYTDLHDFDCSAEGCRADKFNLLAQGRDGSLYSTLWQENGGYGSVFKASLAGATTTLYNFDWTTGANPESGLALGTDGNFRGTTYFGGLNGYGTLFKVSATGSLAVLHDFAGADGFYPYSPPIQAKDGNYYGLTPAPPTGVGYKITATGVYKVLTTAVPVSSMAPPTQASDGSFYGTSSTGGVYNDGAVFKMTATGGVKVIHSFNGTDGMYPVGPVFQASNGYLYGTTQQGGLGSGVLFRMSTGGSTTTLHQFSGGADGCLPSAGVIEAPDGNLYGTAMCGTSGDGVFFKLTKSGGYTVLYQFDGYHGSGPTTQVTQHTNGSFYGLTSGGGAHNDGVLYQMDLGFSPFIKLMMGQGKAGTSVQILGQGFTGTTSVKFGGGSATFNVISDTYMTATVPAAGTTGVVTVTMPTGTLTSNTTFKVIPTITSFAPISGTIGASVVITGTGLTQTSKVTFGGVKATFTVNSGTQVTATVPAGAVTGKIAITTPGGTASKGTFTVY